MYEMVLGSSHLWRCACRHPSRLLSQLSKLVTMLALRGTAGSWVLVVHVVLSLSGLYMHVGYAWVK